jgi:hypothetical protein
MNIKMDIIVLHFTPIWSGHAEDIRLVNVPWIECGRSNRLIREDVLYWDADRIRGIGCARDTRIYCCDRYFQLFIIKARRFLLLVSRAFLELHMEGGKKIKIKLFPHFSKVSSSDFQSGGWKKNKNLFWKYIFVGNISSLMLFDDPGAI